MHLKRCPTGARALTEARKILRPQETLADAAVWPDTIKTATYEDGDTALFRLAHPAQDTYHYTNPAFQADPVRRHARRAPGRPTPCRWRASACASCAASRAAFTPREALRLLAHLVGDMHQPLHVGNAFVTAAPPLRFVPPAGPTGWRIDVRWQRARLRAAGSVQPALVLGQPHRQSGDAQRRRADVRGAADGGGAAGPELEGHRRRRCLARALGDRNARARRRRRTATSGITIYLGPDETGPHAASLADRAAAGYDDRSRAIVRTQLAKGGYRLAAVLRAIWP